MRRVVLESSAPREAFEAVAHESGWRLSRAAGPDDLEPYTSAWRIPGRDTVVQYTEDDLLFAAYVVINGSQTAQAIAAIEQRLDTVTLDAAIRRSVSAVTLEERAQALVQAVIAADPDLVQPAVVGLIRQALCDRFAGLRRTAIATCAYLNWTELDVLLARVISRDPDPDVVRFASDARALRRQHVGSAA